MDAEGAQDDGRWFVVNVAEAPAWHSQNAGSYVKFESDDNPFPHFAINIHVLRPGEPNGKYHAENQQECFLVLDGECLLLVEEEERLLRQWDFVYCAPGVRHIFVGAGDAPCAILMVGYRAPEEIVEYPASELAARYGAQAPWPTSEPSEAYSDWDREMRPGRLGWPSGS
jgi:uncharacterized cupin superfamily protein